MVRSVCLLSRGGACIGTTSRQGDSLSVACRVELFLLLISQVKSRAGSVRDSDMDVLVTGRRRRIVTVVQWHAAARARMIIALGWVMHDRMARVSDWGVT